MPKQIIETFGRAIDGDSVKLDLFQFLRNVHWNLLDVLVITCRQDLTYVAEPDTDYWLWSSFFGAASLEDNLDAGFFTTGSPFPERAGDGYTDELGRFTFPSNFGSDSDLANIYYDGFQGTSQAADTHLEARTEVYGIPNPVPPAALGFTTEITSASVPVFKDSLFDTQSFMFSGASPDEGTTFPASVPPTPIAWGDVLTLKRKYKNWRADVAYDGNLPPPDFLRKGNSIAVFDLKNYKEPITLTFTTIGSNGGNHHVGNFEVCVGAFIMRGLQSFTNPVDGQPKFKFPKTDIQFGLKFSEIPTTFPENSPVRDFKKATSGTFSVGETPSTVTKTTTIEVNPTTKKVTTLAIS